MAAPNSQRDPRNLNGEIPSVDLVMRDFAGMNVSSPRMSIRDDQFSWLENYMPIASGNLASVLGPEYLNLTYTGKTTIFSTTVNISGIDYVIVFLSDGSADYVTAPGGTSVQFASAGTFTAPYAIPYASFAGTPGVLIIDPVAGYFDFNITTALTLTSLSRSITSVTVLSSARFPGLATVTLNLTGGGGTGAVVQSNYMIAFMTIVAAGTGYVVGDVITITAGVHTTPAMLTVTAVNGSGGITALTFTPGLYTGPTNLANANVGFNTTGGSGGSGSGATFNAFFVIAGYTILNPGSGYTSAPTITDTSGGTFDTATVTVSGATLGTTLAAYAGRVWIAYKKSITYTDVSSYNSFGGAGGQLTINDSYLHNNINAVFSTNGYLYIFGDDSIDVLSNVQVNSGVTSFSRVNITTSIGTSYPQSITAYYRSLMFANNYGFYALSGATPQKISEDLDGLFTPGTFVGGLVAGTVTILGILCMCWAIRIVDSFTTLYGTNTTRTLMLIFFKGKWYVHYPGFDVAQYVSIPTGSVQTLYAFGTIGGNSKFYQLFEVAGATLLGMIQTKLWDGGQPILDKEVIRAGLAAQFQGTAAQFLTVTTDNEFTSQPVTIKGSNTINVNWINNSGQIVQFQNNSVQNVYFFPTATVYFFGQGDSTTNAGKYFGMTLTTSVLGDLFLMLAMEYRATRSW